MNFQADFTMPEDFWYGEIQKHVDDHETVPLRVNSARYRYTLNPKYPKFICTIYDGDRVIHVRTRIYFKPGQCIEDRSGRIGIVQEPGSNSRTTPVKWSIGQTSSIVSSNVRALKHIAIGLVCNSSFTECKRDRMRIVLETKGLTNRINTQWLVIIQRMGRKFKWVRLANLEPMKDEQFEYWWARPEANVWKLLRPSSYTYMHDFWETRIIRDPVHGASNFPSGSVQEFDAKDLATQKDQDSILKTIRIMFRKRHLLKPNLKKPIPIRLNVLQRSLSDILQQIQREGKD